jgi:hypothetical protein
MTGFANLFDLYDAARERGFLTRPSEGSEEGREER